MIVRAIDSDGDWQFGKGRNDYKKDNDAIQQDLQTRLSCFLGDCFFDMSAGIDWFNLLGSKNTLALKLAVNSVILNTQGITAIIDVVMFLDNSTRNLSLRYVVETVYTQLSPNTGTVSGTVNFLLTESGDVLTTESGDGLVEG